MKTVFWLACLAPLVMIAGCQSSSTVRERAGGAFVGLQNATLVLESDLTIPPNRSRVFLQDGGVGGEAVASGGFDSYRPHCAIEIRSIDHGGFPVNAGEYRVTRVQRTTVQVVAASRLQVASAGGGISGGGSASYYDGYHFWLASDSDPEVRRMSCYGVYAQPFELFPPTLDEINTAIRGIGRLVY